MPRYDYMCKCGEVREAVAPIDLRPEAIPCECGGMAKFVILTAPALHTVASFTNGLRDPLVQRSIDTDGSYVDPNLSYDKTGKVTRIKSMKHRDELMKARGLYELPATDMTREVDRDKQRQAKSFSATGTRG